MNYSRYHLFFFLLLIPFLLISFHCSESNLPAHKSILATVGNRIVTTKDFVDHYKALTLRTGISDNGQVRRAILKNMIADELFVIEAYNRGLDKDSEGRHEKQRIQIQELLNAYFKKVISPKITVSEAELRTLYVRLNTKLKTRHLYAPTRTQADSLYREVMNGKSFEELAKNVFKDPVLRNSGGLLGYITIDEMEPAFEEAAFKLKTGEVSRPVRTNDGYSIIRVDSRSVKPMITENDYLKHRSKLLGYWKSRKTKKAASLFVDSLRRELDIQFNEPTVNRLYGFLKEQQKNNLLTEQNLVSITIDGIQESPLVSSRLGDWDVQTFQKYARFTSEKQQHYIRRKEDFKDFIAGLVVRAHILAEVRKMNLQNSAGYRQRVVRKFEDYLLERMQNTLYREINIPEDTLRAYYNREPGRFSTPPKVNLREIVLNRAKDTLFVSDQLRRGKSFSGLAKKYSVRRWSAENKGELGFLTPADLGKWSSLAFSIKKGEWTGPVKMDSFYVYLQCIAKIPSEKRSFEEARNDVEKAVKAMRWEEVRVMKINELRRGNPVESHPDKLMSLKLN